MKLTTDPVRISVVTLGWVQAEVRQVPKILPGERLSPSTSLLHRKKCLGSQESAFIWQVLLQTESFRFERQFCISPRPMFMKIEITLCWHIRNRVHFYLTKMTILWPELNIHIIKRAIFHYYFNCNEGVWEAKEHTKYDISAVWQILCHCAYASA